MKKIILIVLTFLVVTVFSVTAAERQSKPKKDTVRPTLVVYKTIGEVELKLHVFEPSERDSKELSPAIVFFFGGGWVGGTPKQFYHQCEHFASTAQLPQP